MFELRRGYESLNVNAIRLAKTQDKLRIREVWSDFASHHTIGLSRAYLIKVFRHTPIGTKGTFW